MLLDIEMPKMDGFEVAKWVRSNEATRELPIIMITSRTGTSAIETGLAVGPMSTWVNRFRKINY